MKLIAALLLLSLVPPPGWAQEVTARTGSAAADLSLMGTWVAKRVENRSGGSVMSDEEVAKSDLVFVFDRSRLTLYTSGRKTPVNYTREGDIVRTNTVTYQIEKITPFELILVENAAASFGQGQLRLYLARFEGSYADYNFSKYVAPNLRFDGDTFYVMNEYVFPKFTGRGSGDTFFDSYQNSYAYIEDLFRQQGRPRRDRFRVSFLVGKTGAIEAPAIVESTDNRYNEALLRAIRSTSGRWIPATANGRPARVQINYEFPYDLPEDQPLTLFEINQLKAKDFVKEGLRSFERKRYPEALGSFNQALALDPGNVSVRLNRAATYYQLNQPEAACTEWKYLQANGDKTAARYAKKYCR